MTCQFAILRERSILELQLFDPYNVRTKFPVFYSPVPLIFTTFVQNNSMNRLISLLVITLSFSAFGQNFLDQHTGAYQGTLYFNFPKDIDSVGFTLVLEPAAESGQWTNTIHYLFPRKSLNDLRVYRIFRDSVYSDDFHFLREEGDGIVTSETRIGNTFYTSYQDGHLFYDIQTTYGTDYIDYQLNGYSVALGEESSNDGTHPRNVTSYPLMVVQKARLYKQKDE